MDNTTPILVNDYYVFSNTNNKYSVDKFTEEQAIEAEASNENCFNCMDCIECISCNDCVSCSNAKNYGFLKNNGMNNKDKPINKEEIFIVVEE